MKTNYRVFLGLFMVVLTGCTLSRAFRHADAGDKLLQAKDYDGAIENYSKAISLRGDQWFWLLKRGESYEAKGEFDMAIADYSRAIEDYGDLGLTRGILKRGHYDNNSGTTYKNGSTAKCTGRKYHLRVQRANV
jgi:tetratricopeptide (TPR) repeat protein